MNQPPNPPDEPDDVDEVRRLPKERWIYGGIRVLDDKRVHAWIDPTGRELLYTFKRAGSWAVGSYYTARVTRTGTSTRLHTVPTYTGDGSADEQLRRELWANHTAARSRLAALTRERNDARRNAIDEALQPLIAAARTLKTSADRDAFTAYVIRQLITSWTSRTSR